MTNTEKHPEVKQIKLISDLIKDQQSFEVLLNKVMLFSKDSKYFELSGWVTAALLDYDHDGIARLAIHNPKEWITYKLTKEQLTNILKQCEVVIGNNFEESFYIKKEDTKDVDTAPTMEYIDKKIINFKL